MDTFMGRYRNVTILAAAIFFQILGLAVQIKRPNELNQTGAGGRIQQGPQSESSRLIRVWAVTVIAPMEKAIVHLTNGASGIWQNYFYLRGVRQENRQLRDQIEQLRLEQVRLKQDADQAHRLQALLGFKEQFIGATTPAQVIGSSGSEQSRLIYIDKGSESGLKTGMPVMTADGIVGKVLNVIDGGTSQVLLISDQQSGVGAILEQSRLQGVLKGKPSGELIIDKIMAEEDVKPGERILTSGGDQIFPKGLPIGTVAKVSKGSEFLQISVTPAARLNHIEEVLVITKKEEHSAPVSVATSTRAADILAERLPSVPDKPVNAAGANAAKPPSTPAAAGVTTKPATSAGNQPGTQLPAPVTTQPKPQLQPTTYSTGAAPATKPAPLAASGTAPKPGAPNSASPSASATQASPPVAKPTTLGTQANPSKPASSAIAGTQPITKVNSPPAQQTSAKPAPVAQASSPKATQPGTQAAQPGTKPSVAKSSTTPTPPQPKPNSSGDTPQ